MKKVPAPHRGARTELHILRYHLACCKIQPLITVPTHRLPVNAGNASEDTEKEILFVLPALGGPFTDPLFIPLPASEGLSVDALTVLLPLHRF